MSDWGGSSRKAAMKETNNYPQGRKGAKVPILTGPAKSPRHNPTRSGGINRAPKGTGGGAMQD